MDVKTSLYNAHLKYKGKIVPFAGHLLPVQYEKGVIEEHMAVRTAAGLFDVSHMGEIVLKGKDALANIQKIFTNDFENMGTGRARYTIMCNEKGGCVDDVIVYKCDEFTYFIVVNAANREKDFKWMNEHKFGDAVFEDMSGGISQIALQGPKAPQILAKLAPKESIPEKYYHCVFDAKIQDIKCMISRTGYTGEDGYEIYLANEDAEKVWEMLMEAGAEFGVIPCGLGARDTLRLEAGMPLYGHEINDEITPIEAGLGFAVKMNKGDFIGKSALEEKGAPKVKRFGLKALGRGIIREHAEVFVDGKAAGYTTSGTFCPYVACSVAMALLDAGLEIGTKLKAVVRGREIEAEITNLPFYKKGDSPKSI